MIFVAVICLIFTQINKSIVIHPIECVSWNGDVLVQPAGRE